MKFQAGDRCIVTGDSADWNHHFPAGTEVTLETYATDDDVWMVRALEEYVWTDWYNNAPATNPSRHMSEDTWWVRTPDLVLAGEDPTDEEIRQLFGIDPTPHCTTCSCHTKS